MTWFDILKNQVLSNTSLGATMDWENPEIIEDDDDNCRRKLIEIYLRAREKKGEAEKYGININCYFGYYPNLVETFEEAKELMEYVPEEQCCMTLEAFKNHKEYYRHLNKPYKSMHITTAKNVKPRFHFKSEIQFDTSEVDYEVEVYLGNQLTIVPPNKKEDKKKYIEYCKYIFGTEYYNFTYEEVFGDS